MDIGIYWNGTESFKIIIITIITRTIYFFSIYNDQFDFFSRVNGRISELLIKLTNHNVYIKKTLCYTKRISRDNFILGKSLLDLFAIQWNKWWYNKCCYHTFKNILSILFRSAKYQYLVGIGIYRNITGFLKFFFKSSSWSFIRVLFVRLVL